MHQAVSIVEVNWQWVVWVGRPTDDDGGKDLVLVIGWVSMRGDGIGVRCRMVNSQANL